MTTVGWLPAPAEELFGTEATAEESYEVLTVDVPPRSWTAALLAARDRLSCTYFDWLSAVDEPGTGFRVSAHVVALAPVRRLLLRTTVPHEAPTLASAVDVYAGAAWHERETHEMFGVVFDNHPALDHLLLPENFEGHPLRKDFVLAARVAKAWPGAKEPGESEHGGPKRRQMLPPGVPDPNEWGPLKGQLPPAPARPARAPRTAPGDRPARPAGDRPARRARTASEGSASQTGEHTAGQTAEQEVSREAGRVAGEAAGRATGRPAAAAEAPPTQPPASARSARRARTAAEGSASQSSDRTPPQPTARPRTPSAAGTEGASAPTAPRSASGAGPRRSRSASEGSASQRAEDASPGETSPGYGSPVPEAPAPEAPAPGGTPPDRTGADTAVPDSSAPEPPAVPHDAASSAPPAASEGPAGRRSATGSGASRRAQVPRSADAPWHHARPAFDDPQRDPRHPESDTDAPDAAPAPGNDRPETDHPDNDTPANPQGGPQ